MTAALRHVFALLPVRFDDRRFLPRAALGLALRWVALSLEWSSLRQLLAASVAWTANNVGVFVERVGEHDLRVAGSIVHVTVPCTHAEVLAMLAPLLWDKSKSSFANVGFLASFSIFLLVATHVRITVAVLLFARGWPWLWAHDVVLGVAYFGLLAFALQRGAWTRPLRDGSQGGGGGQ